MAEPIRLEIYEPPAAYIPPERGSLVMVRCDCSCADPCPQGRKGSGPACFVWMDRESVSAAKYAPVYR